MTTQNQINDLMRQALGEGAQALDARKKAQLALGLDDLNWDYFFYLYRGKMNRNKGTDARSIRIYETASGSSPDNVSHLGKVTIVYPLAIAPAEMKAHVQSVDYSDLQHERARQSYRDAAARAALWVKKMQAGSGSSMTRATYLSRELGIAEADAKIGAKGTDLFVELPNRAQKISLAEAQLLQTIQDLKSGEVAEVMIHDIVSSETEESLEKLWAKPSFLDPDKTYDELTREIPGLSRSGKTFQSFVPTLDELGRISFNRRAPAGHALFAVDALRAAYRPELRPKTDRPLIAAISNGEDLSSSPDALMIGYLVRERVPIALVTTERMPVDQKGGVVSLLKGSDGQISLTVLETAQAKEAGQEKLFSSLPGAVNTNLALFNYEVLAPLLEKEVKEIGEDEFLKIISPDLISNVKKQKDPDGQIRAYLQLEGAMGSTLMNLDRYWRRKYSAPLVRLINVNRAHRTEFFSPIKAAFDYFMQFHSDRFSFDAASMRIRDLKPGTLPQISLKDPQSDDRFYQDVQNVLDCFKGASVRDLDSLEIEGQVSLEGVVLKGKVRIVSRAPQKVDVRRWIRTKNGRPVLQDDFLEIGQDGQLARRSA